MVTQLLHFVYRASLHTQRAHEHTHLWSATANTALQSHCSHSNQVSEQCLGLLMHLGFVFFFFLKMFKMTCFKETDLLYIKKTATSAAV